MGEHVRSRKIGSDKMTGDAKGGHVMRMYDTLYSASFDVQTALDVARSDWVVKTGKELVRTITPPHRCER